jgi:predicted RNase H-like nuclease (RuvC/YqgF family)
LASTLPTEKAKLASLEAEIKTIHELISTESKMIENQVKEEMLNAKPSRAAKSQPKLPLDFDITKAKSWHKTPKWIAYENQIWKLQQEIKQQTKRIKDIETRTAEIEYELQSCVWLNLYHTTIVDYDKKIRDLARSLQQARNLNTNASPNPGSESASVSSSIMNTLLASNRHSTVE